MVVKLPRLHSGQLRALSSLRRFAVVVAGRRWGKTRLAATISIERALRGKRVWWVAPVYDLARAGWDDITFLASQIPGITLRKADRAISFPGGGEIWVRSADRPHNLRAFGIDLLVLDEAAFLRRDTWNTVLRPSLADRGGSAIMISTPAGKNWFYEVAMRAKEGKLPDWSFYTAPTWDNPLIQEAEIKEMETTMPRRSFLQEIAAQFLDQEGALWSHDWIKRVPEPPELVRVVVGVDPAASSTGGETGIVVAGLGKDGFYYVLADKSVKGTVEGWRNAVVSAYKLYDADAIVAEANQGGDMVEAVIRQGDERLPVRLVRASRGKAVRAEPVAALYERGLVFHAGIFRELEAQMTGWVPGEPSPDRMDALVWAITDLSERRGGKVGVYSVRV